METVYLLYCDDEVEGVYQSKGRAQEIADARREDCIGAWRCEAHEVDNSPDFAHEHFVSGTYVEGMR